MKKIMSLVLTFAMLATMFSMAFNVNAASGYAEDDLLTGTLFNSTATASTDGTNHTISGDIWSYTTLAGTGSTNQNISEIEGITVDDGKTLLSSYDREGVKIYAIAKEDNSYSDAISKSTSNAASFPKYFDGQIGPHNDFQSQKYLVASSTDGSGATVYNSKRDYNYSLDIIIDLGSVCDISGFIVAGSGTDKYRAGMYRIHASKERAMLYNTAPLIDFTDNLTSDNLAKANANDIYSIKEGKKILARYVMFRIADTCSLNVVNQSVNYFHDNLRAAELAVYGTPVETKEGVSATVTTSGTPAAPTGLDCLIADAEARYILPSKTDNTQSTTGDKTITAKAYDGSYAAEGYDDYVSGNSLSGYGHQSPTLGYTVDDKYFHEITYTLNSAALVNKIQVVGHTNPLLTTGRYVLFAGDDKDTLYSPENIIYDYDNSTVVNTGNTCIFTGDNTQFVTRQQVFDFGEGFNAKYVGMRAYDPCGFIGKAAGSYNLPGSDGGAIYLRLHEFNVFGQSEYTVENNAYSFAQYQANVDIARSLIADKEPVVKKATNYLTGLTDGDFSIGYVPTDAAPDIRTLTDSDAVAPGNMLWKGAEYAVDTNEDGKTDKLIDNGTDMYQIAGFDMGKKMTVSSLSFISHTSDVLRLYKYQLSFADSANDLFGANAVYTTDVITATATSATVSFNKEISAQFVGFKVVCGVTPSAVGSSYGQSSCYARVSHISVFGNVYGSKSTVVFKDKMDNELFIANTDADGYLLESDLEYVNALVPQIYGYNKKQGENGQEWSSDIYGAVLENITVTPLYEKDSTLKYTLTHNKIQGEPAVEEVEFDEYVTVIDDAAESFKVGDSVIGGADTASFYAAGDITVDSSTDAAPTAPTVTVLNAVTEKVGAKQSWRVFAHAYIPEGYTAVETGAIFLSPYTENQLSKDGIADWNLEVLGTKYAYVKAKGADGANEAMLTLNGVASGVTRYAKAYVAYTNGTTTSYAYSDKLTKVFG